MAILGFLREVVGSYGAGTARRGRAGRDEMVVNDPLTWSLIAFVLEF